MATQRQAKIIKFPRTEDDTGIDYGQKDNLYFNTTNISDFLIKKRPPDISIDELYPVQEARSYELGIALQLLEKGIKETEEALNTIRSGNQISSDDAIQRLQALLPELFNCRILGDSFAEIINALLCSLENMNGIPLNEIQIEVVKRVLQCVRSEPFMHFDIAIEEITKLEKAGLKVEPATFEYIADLLNE